MSSPIIKLFLFIFSTSIVCIQSTAQTLIDRFANYRAERIPATENKAGVDLFYTVPIGFIEEKSPPSLFTGLKLYQSELVDNKIVLQLAIGASKGYISTTYRDSIITAAANAGKKITQNYSSEEREKLTIGDYETYMLRYRSHMPGQIDDDLYYYDNIMFMIFARSGSIIFTIKNIAQEAETLNSYRLDFFNFAKKQIERLVIVGYSKDSLNSKPIYTSASSFWENQCDFKTDGTGKSLGLKIRLYVPCTWNQSDGERPHIVKKFSYNAGVNSAISTLTINKMPAIPSKTEIDELFTQKGLKELCEDNATFISGRKLKIDGQDCGEITFKMTRKATVGTIYLYSLQYYLFYKDKMIILGYSAGSTTDDKAKEMFDNYKTLFKGLAGKTVLLSKWE